MLDAIRSDSMQVNSGDWGETLLSMIQNFASPDQLRQFVDSASEDQKAALIQRIIGTNPPAPLNIILTIGKLIPGEFDKYFSTNAHDTALLRVLAKNPSEQLQNIDQKLAARWGVLRSQKWPDSVDQLTEVLQQLFSLSLYTAQMLTTRVIAPKIKFVDPYSKKEFATEQERDVSLYQSLIDQGLRLVQAQKWPEAKMIWEKLVVLCKKYNWADQMNYATQQINFCSQYLPRETPAASKSTEPTVPEANQNEDPEALADYEDKMIIAKGYIKKEQWDKAVKLLESILALCQKNNWESKAKDAEEKIQYCNVYLKSSFRGIPLSRDDIKAMQDMEAIIGEMPKLDSFGTEPFGYVIEANRIVALSMRNQNFKKIPPQVYDLTGLKQLDLGNNYLTDIAPEIQKLENLEMLNLAKNELSILPPEIAGLKSLKELYIWGNQLALVIPQFCELKNLERVDMSKNSIRSLPDRILELSKLQWLRLTGNPLNKLSAATIDALKKLQARGCEIAGVEKIIL
jgi:tetratricopeptide (TPR) repeat protein